MLGSWALPRPTWRRLHDKHKTQPAVPHSRWRPSGAFPPAPPSPEVRPTLAEAEAGGRKCIPTAAATITGGRRRRGAGKGWWQLSAGAGFGRGVQERDGAGRAPAAWGTWAATSSPPCAVGSGPAPPGVCLLRVVFRPRV